MGITEQQVIRIDVYANAPTVRGSDWDHKIKKHIPRERTVYFKADRSSRPGRGEEAPEY